VRCAQSLVDREGMEVIQAEAGKARDAALSGAWDNATEHWMLAQWAVIETTHGVDFYNIHKFQDYWHSTLDDKPELQLMLQAATAGNRGNHPSFIVGRSV